MGDYRFAGVLMRWLSSCCNVRFCRVLITFFDLRFHQVFFCPSVRLYAPLVFLTLLAANLASLTVVHLLGWHAALMVKNFAQIHTKGDVDMNVNLRLAKAMPVVV
ncbi:hypothetical protein K503DRAFT_38417 [Rhizopogon vinicolor AM-OR11-026]|uniref:Uncharacterized protein n=1 Tax=Rhizopogon vinicolor AM-OR11-026 TaxID=1314800 RepID=A0A1B7MH16_9AGAM|nr:hypothetical protein K503DRAFT_38417 [Rhizopogon vinicolor AM-OR11-026]